MPPLLENKKKQAVSEVICVRCDMYSVPGQFWSLDGWMRYMKKRAPQVK